MQGVTRGVALCSFIKVFRHYILHQTNIRHRNGLLDSKDNPVRHISPCRLGGPDDLDHLAPLDSEVTRHRVALLDPWKLVLLKRVLFEKLLLLRRPVPGKGREGRMSFGALGQV